MIIDFQKLIVAMEGQDFCMIFRNSVNALELVAMHEFQEALHLKYQKRTHSFRVQLYWPQCRRRWSGIGMSIWDDSLEAWRLGGHLRTKTWLRRGTDPPQ